MLDTPKALRLHIGIFGRRNVGKSSLLNALTRQAVSIVSDTPGTTTDPVEKTLELAQLGPVVLVDTPGLDDSGDLGAQRMERALAALPRMDVALIVTEGALWGNCEQWIATMLKSQGIPFFVIMNKADIFPAEADSLPNGLTGVPLSTKTGQGLDAVGDKLALYAQDALLHETRLVGNLLPKNGLAVLVVPLDQGAPKGRLILPQVQTVRDVLDGRGLCLVTTEKDLKTAFCALKNTPDLVICDSQAVGQVVAETPPSVPLTTFSILMARLKGDLPTLAAGAAAIGSLRPGSGVLMMESCSHHPHKDNIGRVKIPRLLQAQAGGMLRIGMCAGKANGKNLSQWDLIVHCGGCAITRRQMLFRLREAQESGVPVTNYGIAIAFVRGVLERVLAPFPEALSAYRDARQHAPALAKIGISPPKCRKVQRE